MGKKVASVLAILVIILIAAGIYFVNPFEKQAQGGLQVVTYETDASLFLNDQYLDKSPFIDRKINAGRYTLNIAPDNKELVPHTLPITVNPGTLTVVYWKPGPTAQTSSGLVYELEPITDKKYGELQVVTEPNEAIINLGNRNQEFAPHIFKELEPGDHTIEISLPGYERNEQRFNVSAGYRLKITAKLAQTGPAGSEIESEEEENSQQENRLEENQEELESTVTIKSTNYFQEGKEVLRVRDDSSTAGLPVGFVAVGETLPYQKIENGWYLIAFTDAVDQEEKEGWVSGQFVEATAQEKPSSEEIEKPTQSEEPID
jgi:hypothetical protein